MIKTNRYRSKQRLAGWRRWILLVGSITLLLVLVNGVLWVIYRGKVLPNVSLGAVSVGSIPYDKLNEKVSVEQLLPNEVILTKESQSHAVSPRTIGVAVDWTTTQERLKQQRSWLPLLQLVRHRTVPVELTVDDSVFAAAQSSVAEQFAKQPLQERIAFENANFVIAPAEPGYKVDETTFRAQLLSNLEAGKSTFEVPTQVLEPEATTADLAGDLQALRKKLAVKISLNLSGKLTQPSAADFGAWFVPQGQTMIFSSEKAKVYAATLGDLANAGNAALAIGYAMDKNADITFMLSGAKTSKKYTYCAATKGVDQTHLAGFVTKTAAVLGDPRGWNASGKIAFERVESNCDFSLWLSAPSQMTSFGGLCDSYYSCRSGRNVVINFDRWQGATDPWNAAKGSLEDYRVMVTNHEVGHWLGFGHANCSGPGQPAPVMQQQSISLQGCTFNPWPVADEVTRVKQARGIAILPAREDYAVEPSCCCADCSA